MARGGRLQLFAVFLAGMILGSFTAYVLVTERYESRVRKLEERLTILEGVLREKEDTIALLNRTAEELRAEISTLSGNFTVITLPNEKYFEVARGLIERANKSVYVAMYAMKYDPKESISDDPVNMLLNLIVEAKKRGLEVRILVDDVTFRDYRATIDYLKENRIPVKLDPKKDIRTHVKIMVIDGEWVFVGSHNWTESALSYNNEYSLLVRSKLVAIEVESYLNDLWDRGREVG